MRRYDLCTTFMGALTMWGPILLVVMVGTVGVVLVSTNAWSAARWQLGFLIPWLAAVGVTAIKSLHAPRHIELEEDGRITFVGLLGRTVVHASDIQSIAPAGNRLGVLIIRHSQGKVTLLNQFDRFHEFLTELERLNPGIDFRGC